ncbi:hypothetical protein GALL_382610 [mine drainage metagenome]|uniref:Uncharacterized protein n=1 Tax=mine drainage metagenome TaxID=410659 RepID=A0A1J5QVR6_9ZZZZ
MNDKAHFHWSEGNKFAIEIIRANFFLNSSVSAALIAFMATTKSVTLAFILSTLSFFIAAILGASLLMMGYYINLRQGNSANAADQTTGKQLWESANGLQMKMTRVLYQCPGVMVLGSCFLVVGFYQLNLRNGPKAIHWTIDLSVGHSTN